MGIREIRNEQKPNTNLRTVAIMAYLLFTLILSYSWCIWALSPNNIGCEDKVPVVHRRRLSDVFDSLNKCMGNTCGSIVKGFKKVKTLWKGGVEMTDLKNNEEEESLTKVSSDINPVACTKRWRKMKKLGAGLLFVGQCVYVTIAATAVIFIALMYILAPVAMCM